MKLIKCKACAADVWLQSRNCLPCGAPVSLPDHPAPRILSGLFIAALLMLLGHLATDTAPDDTATALATIAASGIRS